MPSTSSSPDNDDRREFQKLLPTSEQVRELCSSLGIPVTELEERWAEHGTSSYEGILAWQEDHRTNSKIAKDFIEKVIQKLEAGEDLEEIIDDAVTTGHRAQLAMGLSFVYPILSSSNLTQEQKAHLLTSLATPQQLQGVLIFDSESFNTEDICYQHFGYIAEGILLLDNIKKNNNSEFDLAAKAITLLLKRLILSIPNEISDYHMFGGAAEEDTMVDQVEPFLLKLAVKQPSCSEFVADLLPVCEQINELDFVRDRMHGFYWLLLDIIPTEFKKYDLDIDGLMQQHRIQQRATDFQFELIQALLPLGEQPEWSNPIHELVTHLNNQGVVQITSQDIGIRSQKIRLFMNKVFEYLDRAPTVHIDQSNLGFYADSKTDLNTVKQAVVEYLKKQSRELFQAYFDFSSGIPKRYELFLNELDYLIDKVGRDKIHFTDVKEFRDIGEPVIWFGVISLTERENTGKLNILRCNIKSGISAQDRVDLKDLMAEMQGGARVDREVFMALLTSFEQYVIPELVKQRSPGLFSSIGFNGGKLETLAFNAGCLQYPDKSLQPDYLKRQAVILEQSSTLHVRLIGDDKIEDAPDEEDTSQLDLDEDSSADENSDELDPRKLKLANSKK